MKAKTFTKVLVIAMLFWGAYSTALAQNEAAKFGKIEESELLMKVYDQDTSAAAVVLSDFGYSRFLFANNIKLVFERHIRIKILKKSGYDWADVQIPLYRNGTRKEVASGIKGYTYNLVDGKIVKDKLESKAVFDEKMNENVAVKKFTMPNVKEGSVIEYTYTVTSDFFETLQDWEFQTSIPTVWSEYRAQIPEYFDYKFQFMGYHSLHDNNSERQAAAQSNMMNNSYRWVMKDVPALREERFITTIDDYRSKIEFELQQVKFPGELPRTISGSWDDIVKDLLKEDQFGVQLNRNNFFKNELAAVAAKYSTPEQKLEAIHELVKKTVKWNGKNGLYTTSSIRKAYDNGTGNVADINLLLTSMLLEAGFDATPVLVSTREHGRAFKGAALITKFNYVIAHVNLDGKTYLLDATSPLLPMGMLPYRVLNGEGYLVKSKETGGGWVPLKPSGGYATFFNGEVTLNEKGEMTGKATESHSGYSALFKREEITDEGEAKYLENFTKEVGEFKIDQPTLDNLKDLAGILKIGYNITASGNDQQNSVLYLNPMLGHGEKENPFKLEKRLYPVDFGFNHDETYMVKFNIPAGYELDEIPKNMVLSLPDNGGKFTYMISVQGSVIQVLSKISLNKPVFYAQEYPNLKEFYNHIVAKHAEQIVLKAKLTN
ncbi:DUF3857 domain-containing protein [Botryobacter ruber]|uniref:DUF3857 domain-containing protein n=1 Tax=Botryobacter ruber TaxID=2171629 RepID=UPI000E0AD4BA|nr:DUF3857 domain-containing protein [Botryobacter ruber]